MSAVSSAWQAALAAEQQADFGYALLGPQLHPADQGLARACAGEHAALAERTTAAIAAAGLTPFAPAADYPDLYPVGSDAAAVRLAVRLEGGCAQAWRYLYAVAASATGAGATVRRAEAQGALTAAALRAMRWRQRSAAARVTVAFPGVS